MNPRYELRMFHKQAENTRSSSIMFENLSEAKEVARVLVENGEYVRTIVTLAAFGNVIYKFEIKS